MLVVALSREMCCKEIVPQKKVQAILSKVYLLETCGPSSFGECCIPSICQTRYNVSPHQPSHDNAYSSSSTFLPFHLSTQYHAVRHVVIRDRKPSHFSTFLFPLPAKQRPLKHAYDTLPSPRLYPISLAIFAKRNTLIQNSTHLPSFQRFYASI